MLQTTNSLFNTSLLKYVSTESLLAWHRVRLANLMARSGKEWAGIYTQYNSGKERRREGGREEWKETSKEGGVRRKCSIFF